MECNSCKKESTALTNGSRLLGYANVKVYIRELAELTKSDSVADMSEIKAFWTEFLRDDNLEPKERLKSSELLAKTYGAFLDKLEINQDISILNALDKIEQIVKKRLIK